MKAVIINLERTRGDKEPIKFGLYQFKSVKGKDLTGASFVLSVTATPAPTSAVYEFQSTGIVTNIFGGKVTFPISANASDRVGNFFYDIEMTIAGINLTIVKGSIDFEQDRGK